MRSLATRDAGTELSAALPEVLALLQAERLRPDRGRDLRDRPGRLRRSCRWSTLSLYVMTPEFGAASQLEKIDMLDFADFVAINKFDRKGAEDALRDVRKQCQRNRGHVPAGAGRPCRSSAPWPPASTTTASPRSTRRCCRAWQELGPDGASPAAPAGRRRKPPPAAARSCRPSACATSPRSPEPVRDYHRRIDAPGAQSRASASRCDTARALFERSGKPVCGVRRADRAPKSGRDSTRRRPSCWNNGRDPRALRARTNYVVRIRDKEVRTQLNPSPFPAPGSARCRCRRVRGRRRAPALPDEGKPARLIPVHRRACSRSSARARTRPACSPARAMRSGPTSASTGCPKACRRTRLSTAFDSVTLYGSDPDPRPDIYGKVGNSGVSIATLDDMKVLYFGLRPVRAVDLGVDDHQRARPDHPGHVHEHRDRPAGRQVRASSNGRDRRRTTELQPDQGGGRCRPCAARCRPTS